MHSDFRQQTSASNDVELLILDSCPVFLMCQLLHKAGSQSQLPQQALLDDMISLSGVTVVLKWPLCRDCVFKAKDSRLTDAMCGSVHAQVHCAVNNVEIIHKFINHISWYNFT